MKKKKKINLTPLGKLIPVQTRSFRYPRFIPVHQDLLQCGIREIDVMLYGLYESCAKRFGMTNANEQVYIRVTNAWAAQQLNVSSSTIKRARSRLVGYGLILSCDNGRYKPADTILCTWHKNNKATESKISNDDQFTIGKQTFDVDEFFGAALKRSYRTK